VAVSRVTQYRCERQHAEGLFGTVPSFEYLTTDDTADVEQPAGRLHRSGKREVYTLSNSRWSATADSTGHSIRLDVTSIDDASDADWTLQFYAPVGARLTAGTYYDTSGSSPTRPYLDVDGSGRGCNSTTGNFTLTELTIVGTTVTRLALDFEQHCEGVVIPGRPLRGSIRLNSTYPSRPAVAITTVGSGARVSLSPGPTDCVGRCIESYFLGSSVQLLPTPQSGWVLSGWSGDPDCLDGVLTVDSPIACTATFTAVTVAAASVTPGAGSGSSQTFALQYTDSIGATDLATTWVWFNATFASSSANSCMLYYNRATATLFLLNDGQSWMPGTIGAGGMLQTANVR
jgi:hypothetical protein